MVKKEVFRGLEESQLREMTLEQFMPLVCARERRTLLRINQNPKVKGLVEKVRRLKKAGQVKKAIRTHARDAVIIPEWLGLTFAVHNGKEYKNVAITVANLGKRLGDFAHSTGRVLHSGPGVGATRGSKFVPLK
ncbi:MAG: ribosomal protein S19 family protein [Candidatus Bilamarchaeaceae archaeon]